MHNLVCQPGKNPGQPAHPLSLISLHCLHKDSFWPWLHIECLAKTLIRLRQCAGWWESLLGIGWSVFTGRTYQVVPFTVSRLKWSISNFECTQTFQSKYQPLFQGQITKIMGMLVLIFWSPLLLSVKSVIQSAVYNMGFWSIHTKTSLLSYRN